MKLHILTIRVPSDSWEARIINEGKESNLRCSGDSPEESAYRLAAEYLLRCHTKSPCLDQVKIRLEYYSKDFCYYSFNV
jgi:hypothetical protein